MWDMRAMWDTNRVWEMKGRVKSFAFTMRAGKE